VENKIYDSDEVYKILLLIMKDYKAMNLGFKSIIKLLNTPNITKEEVLEIIEGVYDKLEANKLKIVTKFKGVEIKIDK